ncbi:MAG: dockerin type I repeat-containing protein [Candidatus Zixiibacteriota bacterium]
MKTKLLTFVVLVCIGLLVLAAEVFSAAPWQKSKLRSVYEDANEDAPTGTKYCPKFGSNYLPSRITAGHGTIYPTNCEDIQPAVGHIIQHDQIGDTWYEFQQNGSMGRMISVTADGYRHFSWMYTNCVYPGGDCYRYVDANCENPGNVFMGQAHADGGPDKKAGYCNQDHLHDGTSVIIHHRTGGTPVWASTLTMADGPGSNSFSRHWDIPDSLPDAMWAGEWPKAAVLFDSAQNRDYIHVVMNEGYSPCGGPEKIGYERCYLGANDTLVCQCYYGGATATYKIPKNVNGPGSSAPLGVLDSSSSITPVVAVSSASRRVAVAWMKPAVFGTNDYGADVCYVESMNNGDDWMAGTPWPPPEYNITNFGTGGTERAWSDLSACYDYQDSLHILYVTGGFDPAEPGSWDPRVARLYHWSKKSGIRMITSAIWRGTSPGTHCANIAKMSISALDPVHHPGGDSVYLYAIWTQFDSADLSAGGLTNGELYGAGSSDGGMTWGQRFDLTNTRTPGCAPGSCLSEHWSSLATNMYNGDLHIQYMCDRDAGSAIEDITAWLDNPVMYLDLSAWSIGSEAQGEVQIVEPPKWTDPPLKVTPTGSRNLILKIFSRGNANLVYSVHGDQPCIQVNVAPTLLTPGDSATVTIVLSGSGSCNNTFIVGNVIVNTNEGGGKVQLLPVEGVVNNDYYECPVDAATRDTLENGVLRLYANANCEEKIEDIGTFPDTVHQVFLDGGTMVATTVGGDTLVGRYVYDRDHHLGARDKLYTEECDVSWEPDFYVLYTKDVFMHDLNPPMNPRWFWWETSKQIKFFKSSAPELYKHLVIKYVTVKRHDPPGWWPQQSPFAGYEDTYLGVIEDIDCPWESFDSQEGRNLGGYDQTHQIAWQRGWEFTGTHPQYNDYYCGIALANGGMAGESLAPYGSHDVRNDVYVYPEMGWKEGELCQLAATSGNSIQTPDSAVDRSYVLTARKIGAGSDPNAGASFTVVMVVAPNGLSQLQQYVDSARAIVTRETYHGLPAICGDAIGDLVVNVGDVIFLVSYLFKNGPPPRCPINRADCNSDGVVDAGDIIALINYLFKHTYVLKCPGIW